LRTVIDASSPRDGLHSDAATGEGHPVMKGMLTTLAAGAVLACASFLSASLAPAHAMPMSNLAELSRGASAPIQDVGYVCGPYQCWWQRGAYFYPPAYVTPRVFYPHAPFGWYGDPPVWYGAAVPPPVWYGGSGYRRTWY
jgi:hypothetical protein